MRSMGMRPASCRKPPTERRFGSPRHNGGGAVSAYDLPDTRIHFGPYGGMFVSRR